ncbi:MAG: sigma-70 family RNA polymerase sigma factor [Chitinivibrionales bacterium]|nr:sigma-70 family RNA polymerase sigma factor [Chitinivibrionales bacterium]
MLWRIALDDLVQKCIKGDARAQQTLFSKYKDKVYSLAYKSLGPFFEIDDIVQQIFVNIFKSLPSFKGLSSFDTWIYRISAKICIDQLRKKYRKRQIQILHDSEMAEHNAVDSGDNPHEMLENQELNHQIFQALGQLSPQKRMVVTLYEMDGKTIEEIAIILKIPAGTVKSRLFHGRNELKQKLRKILK